MLTHELPEGRWVFIGRLDLSVTPELLSEFLYQHGVNVPPEAISMREYDHSSNAIISVSDAEIVNLLNWAINSDQLGGQPVQVAELRRNKPTPRHECRVAKFGTA